MGIYSETLSNTPEFEYYNDCDNNPCEKCTFDCWKTHPARNYDLQSIMHHKNYYEINTHLCILNGECIETIQLTYQDVPHFIKGMKTLGYKCIDLTKKGYRRNIQIQGVNRISELTLGFFDKLPVIK